MKRVSFLFGSSKHPSYELFSKWSCLYNKSQADFQIFLELDIQSAKQCSILFLMSYDKILCSHDLDSFDHVLVIHASDLPLGRGWSPYIWEILAGKNEITISCITAQLPVDSGDVWCKIKCIIEPTDLYDQIHYKLFCSQLDLIEETLSMVKNGESPVPQDPKISPTYFRRRSPDDSEIDTRSSICDSFNLLRVCDPVRYPAFFYYNGQKYLVSIQKA